MSYLTKQIRPGSLIQAGGGGIGVIVPFGLGASNGMAVTRRPGRGYADHHVDVLLPASIAATHMEMTVVRPIVGPQKLVTMLGPIVAMGASGVAHNWGFPLTTRTVLVRNTGVLGGNPHNTTFTAKGYDCVAPREGLLRRDGDGQPQHLARGRCYRGREFFLAHGQRADDRPCRMFLPEPGATLQFLAGVIGLLGIAAWRSRRIR